MAIDAGACGADLLLPVGHTIASTRCGFPFLYPSSYTQTMAYKVLGTRAGMMGGI